jgi:hypothetical protein
MRAVPRRLLTCLQFPRGGRFLSSLASASAPPPASAAAPELALPALLSRIQRAPLPSAPPLSAASELGLQWRELQASAAAFSLAISASGAGGAPAAAAAALPLWHARLHACFLAFFDAAWRLAVALHPAVLPGAVAGEGGGGGGGGGAPWAAYAASPASGLPPPLSPARQAATQLGALCAAALELAMACGCAPDAAGGGRLLAVAGLRNADAALAAFNALAGGRGEGGALPPSIHRVLLRACARHGGAPEVALPALWALPRSGEGVARCGGEVAALVSALRGGGGGGGGGEEEGGAAGAAAPLSRHLALGLLLEQAAGARVAAGSERGGEGEDTHDEIFAEVGHLLGRGGATNFPEPGGAPVAAAGTAAPLPAAAPTAATPPPRGGSTSGSDADDEASATSSGGESPLSGSGSEDERADDSDEDSLAAMGLREVAPGVWLPEALLEGGDGDAGDGEEEGGGEEGGEGGASAAFVERSVREAQWWRAAAAHLATTRPGEGFSPTEFHEAMLRLRELREGEGGGGATAAAPGGSLHLPPWLLSAQAHGALWAPRVAARVEAVAGFAALLLDGGGGGAGAPAAAAAAAAAATDPRIAAAAALCMAHPPARAALLAGVRSRVAAGTAAALRRADLGADFVLARRGVREGGAERGGSAGAVSSPPAQHILAQPAASGWPAGVTPIVRQQLLLAVATAAAAAVDRSAAGHRGSN